MVGTFPLNVQEGSPRYILTSQITPSSSTVMITATDIDTIEPISNAYYTIQNEDGSKWCTFYVESWMDGGTFIPTYTGTCTYSSSNTTDVFPEGSICWCIWCKEYYDSIITKIGDGGNTVKVSQLEWDSNLTIPRGYSIESASSQVETNGNMWVGDSLAVETTIECAELITSPYGNFTNLNVGGYNVTLISSQATINITSGGLTFIPITPSNIFVSGTIRCHFGSGGVKYFYVYADCITPVSQSTVTLGEGNVGNSTDLSLSGTIPPHTYALKIRLWNRYGESASIASISLTSNTYTSKIIV